MMKADCGRRRILLVDDHPIVVHGLRVVIDAEPDLVVCGDADSAGNALKKISKCEPELAVVDLALKGSSGLDLINVLQEQYPNVKILVLSIHDELFYAKRVLRAGAKGYLMKREAVPQIVIAIRQVLDGGFYVSQAMASKIFTVFASGWPDEETAVTQLSDREMQVFERIGRRLSMKGIAEELNLSVKTVESYRANIKEKLGLDTAAELADFAREWGWEDSSGPT